MLRVYFPPTSTSSNSVINGKHQTLICLMAIYKSPAHISQCINTNAITNNQDSIGHQIQFQLQVQCLKAGKKAIAGI